MRVPAFVDYRRAGVLVPLLVIFVWAAPGALGDFTENYQTWSAGSDATWEQKDLSGAPFNVAANAVVEVAIFNTKNKNARQGGVRAVGSGLARMFDLMEAENGGSDVVVMHVQADANSKIEIYAEKTAEVTFALLGSWCGPTYVEKITSFTAGADAIWTDENLNGYGVGANQIAEIVMVNTNADAENEAGVRTNGSGLQRKLNLHESEGNAGTSENATMFVKADGTSNATVELYAQVDADVDFYIVGYWSVPPGSYTELFADIGSPASDGSWDDVDLTADGLPDDAIAEIVLTNQFATAPNQMGVRPNGSSLARLLDLQEAEDGGEDAGRMHVTSDSTATIEFYHQDVSEAHRFLLVGYWDSLASFLLLADHTAGQESNAFSGSLTETDAELLGFQLNSCGGSVTVTQLIFRLTDITGIVDGDWSGIEIIVDDDNDGDISGSETTAVGGAGVVSTSGGTITFSTSFVFSSDTNYILRADISCLTIGDSVTIGLVAGDVTSTATETGSTTSVTHSIISGPLLFLKLDDGSGSTAADSSGNGNDATVTGAIWTEGFNDGGLEFDGTGDYVDIPTTIGDSGLGSISFWFITDTDFSGDAIMFYGSDVATGNGGGTENELHVNFTSSETIQFFIEGSTDVSITSSGTYADGAWHHVTATWDIAGNAVLYVDGSSAGSATHDADNFSFSSTHRVGRPGADSNLFIGRMDEVRLYDRALNSAEAVTLALGYGLVANWRLDETSGTAAPDATGNADGTLQNGPIWGDGVLCGALDFDGNNDHITFPHNAAMSLTSFTLTAWVNTDTVANGFRNIVSKGTSGDDWNYWLATSGDEINFGFYNGSSWPSQTTSSNLSANTWYHVAATFDNSTDEIFIYIDGVQAFGGSTTDTPVTNTQAGWLGTDQEGADWNGEFDDVRIYNRALTPAEVKAMADAQIVYYKMDQCSGGTAIDDSGACHDGTLEPDEATGPQRIGLGRVCGALDFDGTGDDVTAGDMTAFDTGRATVAAWVKPETLGDLRAVVSKYDTSPGGGWIMEAGDGASGGNDDVLIGFSSTIYAYTTGDILSAGQWGHWAFVFDGGGAANADRLKFYFNGAAQTLTFVGTIPATLTPTAHEVIVGATTDGSDYFEGVIDEVHMYIAVLSAGDIAELASEANYTITDLGTLPSPDDETNIAIAVNENADFAIAGHIEDVNDDEIAWFFKGCTYTNLGTLGGATSAAVGINDSEQVVGSSNLAGGDMHAFVWASGIGMTDLGAFGGRDYIFATAINAAGDVAGSAFTVFSLTSTRDAFRWVPTVPNGITGTMTDLGTLCGVIATAMGINDAGQVVGGSTTASGLMHPFLWTSGASDGVACNLEMKDLGTLGSENALIVHRGEAVNTAGRVVGSSFTVGGDQHGFLWISGATDGVPSNVQMKDLGTLGGTFSQALDISDQNYVVGWSTDAGDNYHAFVWVSDTIVDLNDAVDINTSWVLHGAEGINDDGKIVGWGTDPAGDLRAFLLTPTRTCACAGEAEALGPPPSEIRSDEVEPLTTEEEFETIEPSSPPLPLPCGASLLPVFALMVSALVRRSAAGKSR